MEASGERFAGSEGHAWWLKTRSWVQAAGAIAGLASQHAADKKFRSPYTEEAKRQGYDLPWWEKVLTASIDDGEFQLGTLAVRSFNLIYPQNDICIVIKPLFLWGAGLLAA